MSKCCGNKDVEINSCNPCRPPEQATVGQTPDKPSNHDGPLTWFQNMVQHCYEYATTEKAKGRELIGIMCEYTPREIIMAAGAMPVCLCGGSAEMIPAAEKELPSNLCPLIKSTYGYCVSKTNPFLEMADLIVAETTCDGKKKMYELMAEHHTMYVLELPQKPEDMDARTHWISELIKFKEGLELHFNIIISDNNLRNAVTQMNNERRLRRQLAELMRSDCPPITGRELLSMKSLIACIPQDIEQYEKALQALPGRKISPPADSRVRVLLTGVPIPHEAERVIDIIETNGGLVVCQENCTGIKPILEDIDSNAPDIITAIADKYLHLPCSVMTTNEARLESLRKLTKQYKPHCIIELIWQACITYDVESHRVRKLCETELGLPYLRIETDYSPSDTARIAMRVQALFETLK